MEPHPIGIDLLLLASYELELKVGSGDVVRLRESEPWTTRVVCWYRMLACHESGAFWDSVVIWFPDV